MQTIFGLAALFLFVLFPDSASARTLVGDGGRATLAMAPEGGTYSLNDEFTVSVYADTGGKNAVAVSAYLYYDKAAFGALEIDSSGSDFSGGFENAIETDKGRIKISRARPTPGVNTDKGLVAKIKFRAIGQTAPASDNFIFDFTPDSILDSNIVLDDGRGTDILSGVYNEKFAVSDESAEQEKNIAAPPPFTYVPEIAENRPEKKSGASTLGWEDLMSEAYAVHNYNNFTPLTRENVGLYIGVIRGYGGLDNSVKFPIARYIESGTKSTARLGSGERAGTINSFKTAFDKLPATLDDWRDVIMIANGRWPSRIGLKAEERARVSFEKIYLRQPDGKNGPDANAIAVAAYGLRPVKRAIDSEKFAIAAFISIYGKNPTDPTDWDLVRAIAYSGAKR